MGILLLAPFFLIRFGLLSRLNREAVQRAAYFAPLEGNERTAYWLYQLSNGAIIIGLLFCRVSHEPRWLLSAGLAVYALGNVLLLLSVVSFAAPTENGFHKNGLYRFSRNPMYVAYFVYFLGCVLIVKSWIILVFLLIFQITAHWIIRAEERWCAQQFGEEYRRYMERVGRYF